MAKAANLSPREIATKYLDFLNKVLAFGPKAPEFANHIQAGVVEFKAAYDVAYEHFKPSEGLAGSIRIDWDDVVENETEIPRIEAQVAQARGLSSADGVTGLRDIFTWLLAHPEILTVIMSLFKQS